MSTAPQNTGQISDGYHTFDELYRYRMLYHAWAVKAWQQAGWPVVKSQRHHDGQLCFGGGWFIVTAQLPTGQVSNHYRDLYWYLFDCPAVDCAPEWDGHTPQQAADRIEKTLRNLTYTFWKGQIVTCAWQGCGKSLALCDQKLVDALNDLDPGMMFDVGNPPATSWIYVNGKGFYCPRHWHMDPDDEHWKLGPREDS